MLLNKVQGVIFDLDDTLVSSALNFKTIKAELGCPINVDILEFVSGFDPEQQTKMHNIIVQHEVKDAHNAVKLHGVDELLSLLHHLTVPCAIVTRNCREAAAIKIKSNDIKIDLVLSREDHPAKPAPDALIHVSQLWQIAPENVLYVGDYLYDVQAANNANTMSCLISYGTDPDYAELADIVVNELPDLSQVIRQAYQVAI